MIKTVAILMLSLFLSAHTANIIKVGNELAFPSQNIKNELYKHSSTVNDKYLFLGIGFEDLFNNQLPGALLFGQFVSFDGLLIDSTFSIFPTLNTGNSFYQSIAIGDHFLVTWAQTISNFKANLVGQVFDISGAKVGAQITILDEATTSGAFHYPVSLGTSFGVIWQNRAIGSTEVIGTIRGQEVLPNGTLGIKSFSFDVGCADCEFYAPTILESGFLIAWSESVNGVQTIFNQVVDNNFLPQGESTVLPLNTEGIQQGFVTHQYNGGIFTAWEGWDLDGDKYAVAGQLLNNSGAKVGDEFLINTTSANTQWDAKIAHCDSSIIVTWKSVDENNNVKMFAQMFSNSGAKMGDEIAITPDTDIEESSAYVIGLDTAFVVGWMTGDSLGNRVRLQTITRKGVKIGNEYVINELNGNMNPNSIISLNGAGNSFFITIMFQNYFSENIEWHTQFFQIDNQNTAIQSGEQQRALNSSVYSNAMHYNVYDIHGRLIESFSEKESYLEWNSVGNRTGMYLLEFQGNTKLVVR